MSSRSRSGRGSRRTRHVSETLQERRRDAPGASRSVRSLRDELLAQRARLARRARRAGRATGLYGTALPSIGGIRTCKGGTAPGRPRQRVSSINQGPACSPSVTPGKKPPPSTENHHPLRAGAAPLRTCATAAAVSGGWRRGRRRSRRRRWYLVFPWERWTFLFVLSDREERAAVTRTGTKAASVARRPRHPQRASLLQPGGRVSVVGRTPTLYGHANEEGSIVVIKVEAVVVRDRVETVMEAVEAEDTGSRRRDRRRGGRPRSRRASPTSTARARLRCAFPAQGVDDLHHPGRGRRGRDRGCTRSRTRPRPGTSTATGSAGCRSPT